MVKFTALTAGGIDYYQEAEPTSGKDGELWLPITETGFDGTQATGVTEDTTVSHSLHSNTVNSVHASNGVVYSGSYDDTVKAAVLDGIEGPYPTATGDPHLHYNGNWVGQA